MASILFVSSQRPTIAVDTDAPLKDIEPGTNDAIPFTHRIPSAVSDVWPELRGQTREFATRFYAVKQELMLETIRHWLWNIIYFIGKKTEQRGFHLLDKLEVLHHLLPRPSCPQQEASRTTRTQSARRLLLVVTGIDITPCNNGKIARLHGSALNAKLKRELCRLRSVPGIGRFDPPHNR